MPELKAASTKQIKALKPYLDQWVNRIEQPAYIKDDPVSFMHAFEDKKDQELAGFFAAIMAWGRRDIVLAKVEDLLQRMGHQPSNFVRNFSENDRQIFDGFKHRTFKPVDMYWITKTLQKILFSYDTFEAFWEYCYQKAQHEQKELITVFHHQFFDQHDEIPRRTRKHISNPEKGSAAKRLYMYLRWVIRNDSPVDPGIMHFMEPSDLLTRSYNDWKAAQELTQNVRLLDPNDPAKYDYALFGIGVQKQQIPPEFLINPHVLP